MPSPRNKALRRKERRAKKVEAAPPKIQVYKQSDERAGLLVTGEFEKAVEECRAQVERISKECRAKNRKFRDVDFDVEHNQYGVLNGLNIDDETYSPSDFRRITQLFKSPSFFRDKNAKAGDIHQGALGDCWFLSALATISAMEGLVEKLCVARDEEVGVYGFIFFRESNWVPVVIDDFLFTSIPKWDELSYSEKELYHGRKEQYEAIARKGGGGLYFAKCDGADESSRETWVPLIEKAYAKLHGDYASLSGGFSCEALEDLTGGISHIIQIEDILDPDKFWTEELLKVNKDRLFGCSLRFDSGWRNGWASATENGLVGNHAYSILKAIEIADKRFLIIRNPWGAPNSEWTGRWSDGDEAWTTEWLARLPEIGHTFSRNDGQFVMEYSDFLSNWEDIDRTLLLDSTWAMSSQMLRVDCRPLPSASTWGDISFTVEIAESTPAILVLSRMDDRYFKGLEGRSYWHFAFTVFKKGESEPVTDSVGMAFKGSLRSDHVELDLEKGTYVVHVKIGRQYSGEADWYTKGRESWAPHKLAKVLTERARSRANASNFQVEEEYNNLDLPRSAVGGVTLEDLTIKAKEADIKFVETQWVDDDEEEEKEKEETPTPSNDAPSDPSKEEDGSDNSDGEDDDDESSESEDNVVQNFGSPDLDLIPENNQLYLTLRAYTKKEVPAVITGHLRDGASFKNLGVQESWWVKAKV